MPRCSVAAEASRGRSARPPRRSPMAGGRSAAGARRAACDRRRRRRQPRPPPPAAPPSRRHAISLRLGRGRRRSASRPIMRCATMSLAAAPRRGRATASCSRDGATLDDAALRAVRRQAAGGGARRRRDRDARISATNMTRRADRRGLRPGRAGTAGSRPAPTRSRRCRARSTALRAIRARRSHGDLQLQPPAPPMPTQTERGARTAPGSARPAWRDPVAAGRRRRRLGQGRAPRRRSPRAIA